jgi:DNA-binding MarR family transcriptional regulator
MTTPELFPIRLARIINKLIFLEKRSILEIGGVCLYPSEIHLMLVIAADPAVNAVTMAKKLGISKGAVSQTLTRLERKGILLKRRDPASRNELTAEFTELGKKALGRHHSGRASLQAAHAAYLATLPESEKMVIEKFLCHVETFIDQLT